MLHQRPRLVVRSAFARTGTAGDRGVGRPDVGVVTPATRRASLLLREPRSGDRGHAAPPARADLRLPVRHAAHPADARHRAQSPGADLAEPVRRRARRGTPRRGADCGRVGALDGLRPGGRSLAGRGPPLPSPARRRPAGTLRPRTRRLRQDLPRSVAPAGRVVRRAAPLHRSLAPGAGAHRPRPRLSAPAGLLDPARGGQAEVPGRLGIGHSGVRHRRPPGGRRAQAA